MKNRVTKSTFCRIYIGLQITYQNTMFFGTKSNSISNKFFEKIIRFRYDFDSFCLLGQNCGKVKPLKVRKIHLFNKKQIIEKGTTYMKNRVAESTFCRIYIGLQIIHENTMFFGTKSNSISNNLSEKMIHFRYDFDSFCLLGDLHICFQDL